MLGNACKMHTKYTQSNLPKDRDIQQTAIECNAQKCNTLSKYTKMQQKYVKKQYAHKIKRIAAKEEHNKDSKKTNLLMILDKENIRNFPKI